MKRIVITFILCVGAALSVAAQTAPRPPAPKDEKNNGQQAKPAPADKQDELAEDVVRVDTNLVNIPVAVMDREGKFITDLRREDFRIYENGVEQQVSFFAPVEQPFTVVLLLDTSPSTRFKLKDIQDAAIAFIDQLRPEDRAVGVTFNSQLRVLNRMMRDREGLRKAIRNISIASGTYLYATVDVMLNKLFRRIPGRKALVLFTDGVDTLFIPPHDTQRRATFTTNMRDAEESDVLIYPVQYNTLDDMRRMYREDYPEGLRAEYEVASKYLMGLAAKTGGRHYRADSLEALKESFASIAGELRRQYSLGYYPKDAAPNGQPRKIRVRVSRENVVVKAKESYTSSPPAKGQEVKRPN
jgi:Ca-activated chloride channel family protein